MQKRTAAVAFSSSHFVSAGREIRREMGAEIAGVIACSINQGGLSSSHELRSHQVDAWQTNDASVVANHSLAVEDR